MGAAVWNIFASLSISLCGSSVVLQLLFNFKDSTALRFVAGSVVNVVFMGWCFSISVVMLLYWAIFTIRARYFRGFSVIE